MYLKDTPFLPLCHKLHKLEEPIYASQEAMGIYIIHSHIHSQAGNVRPSLGECHCKNEEREGVFLGHVWHRAPPAAHETHSQLWDLDQICNPDTRTPDIGEIKQ